MDCDLTKEEAEALKNIAFSTFFKKTWPSEIVASLKAKGLIQQTDLGAIMPTNAGKICAEKYR